MKRVRAAFSLAPTGRSWMLVERVSWVASPLLWLTVSALATLTAAAMALGSRWDLAAISMRTAILGASAALMARHRLTERTVEHSVWGWFSGAAMLMSIASLSDLCAHALDVHETSVLDTAQPCLFPVGVLAGSLLFYQGLILRNRIRTAVADPGDFLNGISAMFAVAAVANLILIWLHGPDRPGPWPIVQLHLLCLGAAFVLMGTTLTVASMSSLLSDVRSWLATLVAAVALAGTSLTPAAGFLQGSSILSSTGGGHLLFDTGWVFLIAAQAGASLLPVQEVPPQPATTQAVTIGALVVLLAGMAILVLCTRSEPALTGPAVLCAGVAVLGASTRVVSLVRDLTTLAVRRQEALTDDLTGVSNRRAFTQALTTIEQDARAGGPTALLVIDLNDFKDVNDKFGHSVGDQLLVTTAGRLQQATPANGLLARLGGDEFAVLLPGTTSAAAQAVAWSLVTAAQQPSGPVTVGLSIGIACHDNDKSDDSLDSAEIFRRADAAMYVAKTSGTQVSIYDQILDHHRRDQIQLTDDLFAIFANSTAPRAPSFEVFYQPQVATRDGNVTGVEALVRWRHPERGLLPPALFLDLVERNGLMRDLTQFVVWTALKDTATWEETGLPRLRVSINLSASCLSDPAFMVLMDEIVAAKVNPAVVTFEVTETTLMSDPELALRMCGQIVAAGFGLSIDDYGTGYSSLAYLSDLPATEIKIDRAFVSRIEHDHRVRAIVAGTVDLAHQLGLRIVAEGAEETGTLDLLRDLGCDEVQGYVYSPPLPAADLMVWMAAQLSNQVSDKVASRTGVA